MHASPCRAAILQANGDQFVRRRWSTSFPHTSFFGSLRSQPVTTLFQRCRTLREPLGSQWRVQSRQQKRPTRGVPPLSSSNGSRQGPPRKYKSQLIPIRLQYRLHPNCYSGITAFTTEPIGEHVEIWDGPSFSQVLPRRPIF